MLPNWNKQHQQTVTIHSPIYWGTTRLSFIWSTELEPSIYEFFKSYLDHTMYATVLCFSIFSKMQKKINPKVFQIITVSYLSFECVGPRSSDPFPESGDQLICCHSSAIKNATSLPIEDPRGESDNSETSPPKATEGIRYNNLTVHE